MGIEDFEYYCDNCNTLFNVEYHEDDLDVVSYCPSCGYQNIKEKDDGKF